MTEPDPAPDSQPDTNPDAEVRAARRRRRLLAVGDVSVGRSADDSDVGWSEADSRAGDNRSVRDDELRREVPPHHG